MTAPCLAARTGAGHAKGAPSRHPGEAQQAGAKLAGDVVPQPGDGIVTGREGSFPGKDVRVLVHVQPDQFAAHPFPNRVHIVHVGGGVVLARSVSTSACSSSASRLMTCSLSSGLNLSEALTRATVLTICPRPVVSPAEP